MKYNKKAKSKCAPFSDGSYCARVLNLCICIRVSFDQVSTTLCMVRRQAGRSRR